jgi:hypothetical protein
VQIHVLSNHADLISGGDALVEITIPAGADASSMRVTLGDQRRTAAFAVRAGGRYFGRIEGLALGANVVTARLPDGRGARITITNYPGSGPVFSGPQVQPWACNAGAMDAVVPGHQLPILLRSGGHRPADNAGRHRWASGPDAYFQPYDPGNPPPAALIAQTTTEQGRTVPFIVRLETGSVDRGQYQIAVLYDPAKPWDIGYPQAGWNRKLFLIGGPGCGISYQEGAAPGVLYGKVLGRWLRDDVYGPLVHRKQLQHGRAGRVADDGQRALHRNVWFGALHVFPSADPARRSCSIGSPMPIRASMTG